VSTACAEALKPEIRKASNRINLHIIGIYIVTKPGHQEVVLVVQPVFATPPLSAEPKYIAAFSRAAQFIYYTRLPLHKGGAQLLEPLVSSLSLG
jgi:hypothetical protein